MLGGNQGALHQTTLLKWEHKTACIVYILMYVYFQHNIKIFLFKCYDYRWHPHLYRNPESVLNDISLRFQILLIITDFDLTSPGLDKTEGSNFFPNIKYVSLLTSIDLLKINKGKNLSSIKKGVETLSGPQIKQTQQIS